MDASLLPVVGNASAPIPQTQLKIDYKNICYYIGGRWIARQSLWMARRALAEPELSANVWLGALKPVVGSVTMMLRALLAVPK
jgi:hypothetical protein